MVEIYKQYNVEKIIVAEPVIYRSDTLGRYFGSNTGSVISVTLILRINGCYTTTIQKYIIQIRELQKGRFYKKVGNSCKSSLVLVSLCSSVVDIGS